MATLTGGEVRTGRPIRLDSARTSERRQVLLDPVGPRHGPEAARSISEVQGDYHELPEGTVTVARALRPRLTPWRAGLASQGGAPPPVSSAEPRRSEHESATRLVPMPPPRRQGDALAFGAMAREVGSLELAGIPMVRMPGRARTIRVFPSLGGNEHRCHASPRS